MLPPVPVMFDIVTRRVALSEPSVLKCASNVALSRYDQQRPVRPAKNTGGRGTKMHEPGTRADHDQVRIHSGRMVQNGLMRHAGHHFQLHIRCSSHSQGD